jgi:hypothetical protein
MLTDRQTIEFACRVIAPSVDDSVGDEQGRATCESAARSVSWWSRFTDARIIKEFHVMRGNCFSVCLAIFASAAGLCAAEPAQTVAPGQPLLLMASATACDAAVTLRVRTVQMEPTPLETVTQVPVRESVIVNGKVVEQTRYVEERRQTTTLRAVPGAVIEIPVDGVAVSVQDLKGKPVTAANVARLLKKETAVLVSVSGPVDPFYLQTTKPGTLIVQMPAQLLNSQPELLPPGTVAPGEPRLSPAKPKTIDPLPPLKVDPTEPPLAPAKRKPNS